MALVVSPACFGWREVRSSRVHLFCCNSVHRPHIVNRVLRGKVGVGGLGGVTCISYAFMRMVG
jgi:hypothetical protein